MPEICFQASNLSLVAKKYKGFSLKTTLKYFKINKPEHWRTEQVRHIVKRDKGEYTLLLVTVVEGDPKAPFSLATTPR